MGKYSLLIVSALIFSMITYSSALRNATFMSNERMIQSHGHNQAHNIAQSALAFALRDLQENGGQLTIPSDGTVDIGPTAWPELNGSFTIRLTNSINDDNMLHVISTGFFDDHAYRVRVGLIPGGGGGGFPWPDFTNAIHSREDLSFANGTVHGNLYTGGKFSIPANATINGDVVAVNQDLDEVVQINSGTLNGSLYTNTTKPNSISFTNWGGTITGNLYVGPGADPEEVAPNISPWHPGHVNGQKSNVNGIIPPQEIPEPEFPTISPTPLNYPSIQLQGNTNGELNLMAGNAFIPDITIRSNTSLTINVGDNVRTLRLNNLDIQQGHLNIITQGDGRLEIFVENNFNIGGSSSMNNNNNPNGNERSPKNLLIAYSGSEKLTFGGAQSVNANFFVESADVELTGGSNFNGNVITLGDNVSITGNAQNSARMLYAPNAHVHMTGSGRVLGSIITNSFSAQGNALVSYSEDYKDTLPDLESESTGSQAYSIAYWN
ncbi:MAG: hypothetical protein EA391_14325 [Balneolaceae bacterium]|nr:MAG: hypothetical protein EA391_14325 [Balneolaceae bacterium]